jgi:hypothetical protein
MVHSDHVCAHLTGSGTSPCVAGATSPTSAGAECAACVPDKAYAHTRTSSSLDRMCQRSMSAQYVNTTTLARTCAQARHWTECANGLRVHTYACAHDKAYARAHKLTNRQNVPMDYECTACAHENACTYTRTSSPLDIMCQWTMSAHMCTRVRQSLRARAHKHTIG